MLSCIPIRTHEEQLRVELNAVLAYCSLAKLRDNQAIPAVLNAAVPEIAELRQESKPEDAIHHEREDDDPRGQDDGPGTRQQAGPGYFVGRVDVEAMSMSASSAVRSARRVRYSGEHELNTS